MLNLDVFEHITADSIHVGLARLAFFIVIDNVHHARLDLVPLATFVVQTMQIQQCSSGNGYGKYTVIAHFTGTEAYYPSVAETAFAVDQAPEATPPPEQTPAPPTDTYVLGFGIAILAAVIIIGVLILLKVNKK